MGLRTASVRHPHVEVMAPALTETNQTQSFKLSTSQSASPVNGSTKTNGDIYIVREGTLPNGKELNNVLETYGSFASELLKEKHLYKASDKLDPTFIMNNCPSSMDNQDDDKMGLQKAGIDDVSSLLKENETENDVDQLFFQTEGGDVDDIMQVIKSMEGVPPEQEIFPLSTSDLTGNLTNLAKELFNDVDVMTIDDHDNAAALKENQTKEHLAEAQRKQARLERHMDILVRRIRKFQVQNMGQHFSGEIAGVFEHVHRTLRRSKDNLAIKTEETPPEPVKPIPTEKMKPISYSSTKNLVKKLESSTAIQANNASRQRHTTRYFGSGSLEPTTYRAGAGGLTTLPQWAPEEKRELQRVSGFMESQLRLTQEELDSDATVSSSGGESCDEMQTYNNPHQQYLPIQKRAAWKYAMDRAAIACRWTWLQSQVADLEYRIRQHSELHRKIRASKECVRLGGASPPPVNIVGGVPTSPTCVNGYRGQLPGASPVKTADVPANGTINNGGTTAGACGEYQCARTRPLVNFRKRKLLQFTGLHAVSKKAARPATIRCGCVPPAVTCALCTGRTDPTHPRDLSDYLSKNEKLGLLDPSYHPVFSVPEDASATLHMEAIIKTPEWQQRSSRSNIKALKFMKGERLEKPNVSEHRPRKLDQHRKKYNRLMKPTTTANPLATSKEIKNRFRGRKSSMGRLKKRTRVLSQMNSLGSDGADEEVEALGIAQTPGGGAGGKYDSPSTSPLLATQTVTGFPRRNRVDSYDIDNIIIPYSVAASTRVEKLPYKEILTPKWRIAESDLLPKYEVKNNGTVKTSQDQEDVEDLSDDVVVQRHEKCEAEEKKKFLSYLKLPIGYGRSRANRRTDSRAESSGANTPDPLSPAPAHPLAFEHGEATVTASGTTTAATVTAPGTITAAATGTAPATTTAASTAPLPSRTCSPIGSPARAPPDEKDIEMQITSLRRRTVSQSRVSLPPATTTTTTTSAGSSSEAGCATPEAEEQPYEKRAFPLPDDAFERLVRSMPDDHKVKTNVLAQDSRFAPSPASEYDDKLDYHDSESTESAFGDEDPNDPEWDVEGDKDRYRR